MTASFKLRNKYCNIMKDGDFLEEKITWLCEINLTALATLPVE
jgi:hypothetical protein